MIGGAVLVPVGTHAPSCGLIARTGHGLSAGQATHTGRKRPVLFFCRTLALPTQTKAGSLRLDGPWCAVSSNLLKTQPPFRTAIITGTFAVAVSYTFPYRGPVDHTLPFLQRHFGRKTAH